MSYGADQDEELAELQRRFMALEDEARTTMEKTMASPRGAANKAGRERTAQAGVRADNEHELAKLDEQITQLRRKHDDLAHANLEKRRELDKLNDRLQDLSREASLPSAEDNPIMKEIRELEARLNRAVTKYEDAQEVRRTYEQIVKRLKEERIGFNNQLEARESTMRAKEADYEELLLMSHDANQSKEMAKQAPSHPRPHPPPTPPTPTDPAPHPCNPLSALSNWPLHRSRRSSPSSSRSCPTSGSCARRSWRSAAPSSPRSRSVHLPPRHPFPYTPHRSNSALPATAPPAPCSLPPAPHSPAVSMAPMQEINAELERREKARRESMTAPSSALGSTRSESGAGRGSAAQQHAITEADIEEEQEKIASYEAAFREIKEATGVADVNEVIQKFITQEETHKSLLAMTRESQTKIESLTEAKVGAQERVQRLKYAAGSEQEPAAGQAGDSAERNKLERQRHKHERLARVMIAVKAGVQHLSERLEGVKLEGQAPMVLTDDNMVEVLQQCEAKMRIVLEAIRQEEEALVRDMGEAALTKSHELPTEPPIVNNCRVRDADGGEEAPSEEEFEEDLEEEVVERDALKKQSGAILDKLNKKARKGGRKKKAAD